MRCSFPFRFSKEFRMKLVQLIALSLGSVAAGVAVAAPLPADTGIAWKLTAAQVTASCKEAIAKAQKTIDAIDARANGDSKPALLEEVETTTANMSDALDAQVLLMNVSVQKDVRAASTKCVDDVNAFNVRLSADSAVYAIAQDAMKTAATPAERRLAQLYAEAGRRTGAGLPAGQRAQVTQLFDRLNMLQTGFQLALGEDKSSIAIDAKEAQSLPPAFIKTLKATPGGYVVNVNESTVTQFLSNEQSAAARTRYYIAYYNRGGQANVKRLADAVALRTQIAHLLGFKTWAAYQLDARMAKTPDRVLELLNKVDSVLLPKARAEIAVLAEMKKADGDQAPFASSDYSFYEHRLEKTKYDVDEEALRQYFPVGKVISSVFGIYQKLLGVHFEEIKPAMTWAPGVTEYSITDTASGAAIGWFFLDLYPREGKYEHFATFGVRPGRVTPNGTQRPVSSIIGNWPVGEPGRPALLSHADVVVFFHEFGHLMHQTLSRAPYETLFGSNVRQDFVEAPSQMLENWMWQPSILKEVSANVKTGSPLPDAVISKIIAAKHVADGSVFSTQAFYASYDMRLHSSVTSLDPTKLWFDLKSQLTALPAEPGTIPEAGFGHLMSGYDAGYYGYLWSLVYAQDMFSVFQKGGLEDPATGMHYRKEILEPGALVEPDVLLHKFLGRDVSYEPFYKYIGVSAP
jgi:thimet oligopeptidase